MTFWLLVRGRGDRRLDADVQPDELRAHSSTRRPAVQRGDLAVCYAVGWKAIFAVVEVVSDPENDPARERWQWRFAIRPLLALDDLREAPPVQAAGVMPRSLGRHSYIRLSEEQFRAAHAAIAGAIVGAGYDRMADRFAAWQEEVRGLTGPQRAERLLDLLPAAADVLELGVGAGAAQSRILAERSRLTGVDVSAEQLRRARARLPAAKLVHADMTAVDFDDASFDAVVSFYVLNHVPREELGPLLGRVRRWLRPGGWFLAAFAAGENPGWQGEWLGVEMFFSGHEPAGNERLLRAAGLELAESEVETIVEPDYGEARFHWVLARKPG